MTVVHSSIGAGFGCALSTVLANVIPPIRYLVQRRGCWLVMDLQQMIPHCIYSRLKSCELCRTRTTSSLRAYFLLHNTAFIYEAIKKKEKKKREIYTTGRDHKFKIKYHKPLFFSQAMVYTTPQQIP